MTKIRLTIFVSLTTICLLIVLAHIFNAPTVLSQTVPIAAQPSGRYQLVFNPAVRADTFLIDTQTGKIWSRVQFTDIQGEPDVWRAEDRIDGQAQFIDWLNNHSSKKN
jgi:hypothetical protein